MRRYLLLGLWLVLITLPGTSIFAQPVAADHDHRALTIEGRVVLREIFNKSSEYTALKTLITNGGKQWTLQGPQAKSLRAGQRVRISGRQKELSMRRLFIDKKSVLNQPQTSSSSASGKRGVAVAFVSWPGSGSSSYDKNAASLAQLTPWSRAASDGKFSWEPVIALDLALSRPLAACSDPQYWYLADAQWAETVNNALRSRGYTQNDYQALGIVLPQGFADNCVPTAYAYADPSCQWGVQYYCNLSVYSYGASIYPVFVHELGHTLSLPHANRLNCSLAGKPVVLTYAGTCQHREYMDYYDPMGSAFLGSMYNASFSSELSWLPDEELVVSNNSETPSEKIIELRPYGGLIGQRAVKIALPPAVELGGQSGGDIFIEYRADSGVDSTFYHLDPLTEYGPCLSGTPAQTPDHNLMLRYVPSAAAARHLGIAPNKGVRTYKNETYILETYRPGGSPCEATMAPGAGWQDPTRKLHIQFLERSSNLSTAKIKISRFSDPQPPTPPNLSLQLSTPSPSNRVPSWELKSSAILDRATISNQDFQVTGGQIKSIAGSDTSYQITVTPNKDGLVTLYPSSSFAISDLYGGIAREVFTTGAEALFDSIAPQVNNFSRLGAARRRETSIEYQISFSEPVIGLTATNIDLKTPGQNTACGKRLLSDTTNPSSYLLRMQKCTEGSFIPRLKLAGISDQAQNPVIGSVHLGPETWIDRSEPAPVLQRKPAAQTRQRRALFTWVSKSVKFSCSLDNRPFTACRSGVSYNNINSGWHLFRLQGRDDLGNQSPIISYRWRVG